MIEVYTSPGSFSRGEPAETHHAEGMTFDDWMRRNVPDYYQGGAHPITVSIGGLTIPQSQWRNLRLDHDSTVKVLCVPKDPVTAAYAVVAALVAVFAYTQYAGATAVGANQSGGSQSIYNPNAQANSPRLGDPIPELAGRMKTFPDYLCQPVRRFVNKRTQALDMMMSVGQGEYSIEESLIGETPFSSLGADVDYRYFGPGQSVTSHRAHRNWYNAKEVGSTVGSAGLRLGPATSVPSDPGASSYRFVDNRIIIPNAGEDFPSTWAAGMYVFARIPQTITVISGGTVGGVPQRDIVEGDFSFSVGDEIKLSGGPNAGDYFVNSFTPGSPAQMTLDDAGGSPATGMTLGAQNVSVDYEDARYRINKVVTRGTLTFESPNVIRGFGQFQDIGFSVGDVIAIMAGPDEGDYTVTDVNSSVTGVAVDGSVSDTTAVVPFYNMTSGAVWSEGNPAALVVTRYRGGSADSSWPGFDDTTTSSATVDLDSDALDTGWVGPFQACPADALTSYVEYDAFFPQGLTYIDEGGPGSATMSAQWQWRDKNLGGAWTSITRTFTDATTDQIGFTFGLSLPYPMVPEMRARRIGAEESNNERIEWYGLRSLLPPATSYPGVTTLAMTLVGSDTIASNSENKVSVIATRKLGYKGSAAIPTRAIAPFFEYIAKDVGYTTDEIDYEELDRLNAVWQGRGDFYDFVQTGDSTAKDEMNRCLSAGFAELVIQDGKVSPARDEPREEWDQQFFPPSVNKAELYSPQNYLEGGLTVTKTAPRPDDTDGVQVEYLDQGSWQTETVLCYLPGDQGRKLDKISVEGVVSRDRAWRIGMRYRRQLRYQRTAYEFATEWDALNSTYLSFLGLVDDVPGYARSGMIKGIEDDGLGNAYLDVTEPFEFEAGKSYVIGFRRDDGRIAGPYAVQPGDDDFMLLAAIPESERPDVTTEYWPDIMFGEAERWVYPALAKSIEPNGFESVSVTAVNYDERIYADDNNLADN